MNHYYMDCMIKERRREESEECKRLQLLKAAGYENTFVLKELFHQAKYKANLWRLWLTQYTRKSNFISILASGNSGKSRIVSASEDRANQVTEYIQ